jgi:hypothetical protein
MMAAAFASGKAMAMKPSEQAAWDRYEAFPRATGEGIVDSAPMLQAPSPTSMGVALAVKEMANGFVEVADNPEMKDAVRFFSEGMPVARIDDRVVQIRMTGLRSSTRYWYRAGAAGFSRPLGTGYWMKPTEISWSKVGSFVTPGKAAPSRFAVINDTHSRWSSFKLVTDKLAELNPPVVVWNGDTARSLAETREDLVKTYLKPESGEGFASSLPVLLNLGNHDYRGPASAQLDSVMMTRRGIERSGRYWQLQRNFAYRQGDIAIIGLETGEDKPDRHPANGGYSRFEQHRSLQARWLQDQFKRTDIATAPYVAVFVHIPIFDPDPNANPGTILEDYAHWQKQCADEWGPILHENKVQVVIAGHMHRYRYDPATADRCWAQIVGGGPETGMAETGRFPTVMDARVENGKMIVDVHNVESNRIIASHEFLPR